MSYKLGNIKHVLTILEGSPAHHLPSLPPYPLYLQPSLCWANIVNAAG
jgi:hypothetical protein